MPMAGSTSSSPRDHAADSDIDLSRKRPRLSPYHEVIDDEDDEGDDRGGHDDHHTDHGQLEHRPGLSIPSTTLPLEQQMSSHQRSVDNDSILGGSLKARAAGDASVDATFKADDEDEEGDKDVDDLWTGARFKLWQSHSPCAQMRELVKTMACGDYLSIDTLNYLDDYVALHLKKTDPYILVEVPSPTTSMYITEEDFWGEFGTFANAMLERPDELFEPGAVADDTVNPTVTALFRNLILLAARIVMLLPKVTQERLSRRDSAQTKPRVNSQLIALLPWLNVYSLLTNSSAPCFAWLRQELAFDITKLRAPILSTLAARDSVPEALVTTFANLARNTDEVVHGWSALSAILLSLKAVSSYTEGEMEQLLDVLNKLVLPRICEKHPRALPEHFHDLVVDLADVAIEVRAHKLFSTGLAQFYEHLIRSEDDAVMPHETHSDDVSNTLDSLCNGNYDLLIDLLRIAWTLRALKAYISSPIIDIRTIGVARFRDKLSQIWDSARHSRDHPLAQFTIRFIRSNNLIQYIFSAESHAGLIGHSENLVIFLAAADAYTQHETDIIWQACTTNVEADFVKASFKVLGAVLRWLDFDGLTYIAQQYENVHPATLSPAAVEFLVDLLYSLREQNVKEHELRNHLATGCFSLRLLHHLSDTPVTSIVQHIRHLAMSELAHGARLGPEYRLRILEQCFTADHHDVALFLPNLEVLTAFLQHGLTEDESQQLSVLLPADQILQRSTNYAAELVRATRPHQSTPPVAMSLYVEVIVRLRALTSAYESSDIDDHMFGAVFGGLASDNDSRNIAWHRLATLTDTQVQVGPHRIIATRLLHRFLHEYVPSLRAEFVPPILIQLFVAPLKECLVEDSRQNTTTLLQHNLWKTLIRFAIEIPDPAIASVAMDVVASLLLVFPTGLESHQAIVRAQTLHIQEQVDELCNEFENINHSDDVRANRFARRLDLLDTVFVKSKDAEDIFRSPDSVEPVLDLHGDSDDPMLEIAVHILTPLGRRTILRLQASSSTTLSSIAARMPQYTGSEENRLIVGGKQIDLDSDPESDLPKIGLAQSGVMIVVPKYTFGCDLSNIQNPTAPVESAVMTNYDRLEAFTDGHDILARRTYAFLEKVRPPASARARVTKTRRAQDLLPIDRPWRARQSLKLLLCQLKDFAQLAIADATFIHNGVVVMEEWLRSGCTDAPIWLRRQVLYCLLQFLREKPLNPGTTDFFEQPETFASCLIRIILDTTQQPAPNGMGSAFRLEMVTDAYNILVHAYQRDDRVWRSLLQNDQFVQLHSVLLLNDDQRLSASIADLIINICIEAQSPPSIAGFYWRVMTKLMDLTLVRPFSSASLFRVASELLVLNPDLNHDEERARSFAQDVIANIDNYEHSETLERPLPDLTMIGLLKLLRGSMIILRSFKKPFDVGSLPLDLFNRLLFPPPNFIGRPLIYDESRGVAFDVLQVVSQGPEVFDALTSNTKEILELINASFVPKYPGHDEFIREAHVCSGLTNLGMTCYMNSLLQQLFANLPFRKFILDLEVTDPQRQRLLCAVQQLFAQMQNGTDPAVDTTSLAQTLRVQTDSQEDVHSFYAMLISNLEEDMPTPEDKIALSKFFTGTFVSQIQGECGHISTRSEPFMDISITVKNKASLQESLNEFVQGEPMAGSNKYKCMTCDPCGDGKLVDAMKRTCLDEIPDNITFCLKRFTWEALSGSDDKVNDRFEFPARVDMSAYQRYHLENPDKPSDPDNFDLVGVIVHQGSLTFGHYWSYVRFGAATSPESATWIQLEDSHVRPVSGGVAEVQAQCFGGASLMNGNERTDNAYVLLYQRASSIPKQTSLVKSIFSNPALAATVPPLVHLPERLATPVSEQNAWRLRIKHIFDQQFANFTKWLIENTPVSAVVNNGDEVQSDSTDDSLSTERDDSADGLASMAISYLLRVILNDHVYEKKLNAWLLSVTAARAKHANFSTRLVHSLAHSGNAYGNIWCHPNRTVRMQISGLILNALNAQKMQDPETYVGYTCPAIIHAHARLFGPPLGKFIGQWSTYFDFIANLTRQGLAETVEIFERFSLATLMEVVHALASRDRTAMKKYGLIGLPQRNIRLDAGPIYTFLLALFGKYVSIELPPRINSEDDGPRRIVDGMICLTSSDWDLLVQDEDQPYQRDPMVLYPFFAAAVRSCSPRQDWRDFAPGQFIAFLCGPRAAPLLGMHVDKALATLCRHEDKKIEPVLQLVLHYCAARSAHCEAVLVQLGGTLSEWNNFEHDTIVFLEEVFAVAPDAIIGSMPEWFGFFTQLKSRRMRENIVQWAIKRLFANDLESVSQTLEASRLRTTRRLITNWHEKGADALLGLMNRAPTEEMFTLLAAAKKFLRECIETPRPASSDTGPIQNRQSMFVLQTELGEAKATLKKLAMVQQDLDERARQNPSAMMDQTSGVQDQVHRSIESIASDATTSDFEEGHSSDVDYVKID